MSFTITIVLRTSTLLNDFFTSSMALSMTDSSPTTSSSSSFLEAFKKRILLCEEALQNHRHVNLMYFLLLTGS